MPIRNQLQMFFLTPSGPKAGALTRKFLWFLIFFIVYTAVLSFDFLPDKVALQLGEVSDRDVLVPRTVSYVDAAKTKKLEMEVLASVANVYDLDLSSVAKIEEEAGSIFQATRAVIADRTLTQQGRVDRIRQLLPLGLPEQVTSELATFTPTELAQLEDHSRALLRKYLQRGVRADEIDGIRRMLVLDVEKLGLGKSGETALVGITQKLLRPNFILNLRETELRKNIALKNIDPVRVSVKTGQVLIHRGDVVTPEQMQAMEELGLHRGQMAIEKLIGLSVFLLILMTMFLGYLYKLMPQVYGQDKHLVLLGVILLITLLLGKAAHFYADFSAPLAAGSLITTVLVGPRVGLIFTVMIAMLYGIIADQSLRIVAFVMMGGFAGIFSISRTTQGYNLVRAGLAVAVVNLLVVLATGVMGEFKWNEIILEGVQGIVGGAIAAIVTTGLIPYLEQGFRITTAEKLLSFARPNHELLQRLLLEAPGTYYHSVLVGNLAETAAEKIGADPVVVRVGAYYHDIGKIKRPGFFIENQGGGENPHSRIAPSLSTMIVTSHIKDGIDLCKDHRLPDILVDIVQQHHGTTLVSYFYKQASAAEHGECIIEEDFHYEGPKPQTKEAALIMLADGCEAAVRSLSKPNSNRIENTVRRVILERLHTGQLNECDLTLRDLSIIGDIYIKVLCSTCHSRIEYPEGTREGERRKTKNGNSHQQFAGTNGTGSGSGEDASGRVAKSSRNSGT